MFAPRVQALHEARGEARALRAARGALAEEERARLQAEGTRLAARVQELEAAERAQAARAATAEESAARMASARARAARRYKRAACTLAARHGARRALLCAFAALRVGAEPLEPFAERPGAALIRQRLQAAARAREQGAAARAPEESLALAAAVRAAGGGETCPVSTGGRDETCPVSTGGRGGGGQGGGCAPARRRRRRAPCRPRGAHARGARGGAGRGAGGREA